MRQKKYEGKKLISFIFTMNIVLEIIIILFARKIYDNNKSFEYII